MRFGRVVAIARLRWDLDGNGIPDTDAAGQPIGDRVVRVRASEVGHVTLWIEDPISRKTVQVTREIREEVQ